MFEQNRVFLLQVKTVCNVLQRYNEIINLVATTQNYIKRTNHFIPIKGCKIIIIVQLQNHVHTNIQ